MGHDIYIGEAMQTKDEDNKIHTCVAGAAHPDAPNLGKNDKSGITNGRFPSYQDWGNFCKQTGLENLFFNQETGLMKTHHLCSPITADHLQIIRNALQQWQDSHPDAKVPSDTVVGGCMTLGRLVWLEFWFAWALKNCKQPAIYNL